MGSWCSWGNPLCLKKKSATFGISLPTGWRPWSVPVVMFTDACVKASAAVAKVFPNAKHFWCYWHIAKNVAKNLKGVRGHDMFTPMVRFMAPALFLGGCVRVVSYSNHTTTSDTTTNSSTFTYPNHTFSTVHSTTTSISISGSIAIFQPLNLVMKQKCMYKHSNTSCMIHRLSFNP